MPIVVAVLGVIIVVLGFVFFLVDPTETPVVKEEAPVVNRTEEITMTEGQTLSQDDDVAKMASANTFVGTGTYLTPARTKHELDVTLTLGNGLVTEADVVYDNGEGFSNPNQERFHAAYKTQVIGKSLNEISLSRVGGASLTTNAFNEALAAIKSQQS